MPANVSKEEALKRIDSVRIFAGQEIVKISKFKVEHPSISLEKASEPLSKLCLRLKQTISDLTPSSSQYRKFAETILPPFSLQSVVGLMGAINGLREDYAQDFLKGFNEMIDAELFSDILKQAKYLLSQNYVRASAVVAGVALESHLRKLAVKNSIPITKDDGKYINADSLNGELRKKEVIDKTLNQQITSYLGLRNDAAHPDAKEINAVLVKSMISGIRIFVEKYPA